MNDDDIAIKRMPRRYSLVRFQIDLLPPQYHDKFPFTVSGRYVFFGEIPNMSGHCVVADHRTGRIYSGYHIEHFVEIEDDAD